jgi:hypothetical protein
MKAVFKSLVNENVKSPKKRRQSLKYTNKDEALTVMRRIRRIRRIRIIIIIIIIRNGAKTISPSNFVWET